MPTTQKKPRNEANTQPQPMVQPMADGGLQQRANQEMAMLNTQADYEERMKALPPKIGANEVRRATEVLRKYKSDKARLEQKIIQNEQFWKMRQWRYEQKPGDDFKPATAWLFSCIQSRYSDIMDSYPTCNFRPRQEDDVAEAKKLSDIVPIILEQNRYEETYSDVAWYILKHGGCVQGIFWDGSKHNGLGDIVVKKIDFINLFWEGGITDIQESENVFNTEIVPNRIIEQRYPQARGKLTANSVELAKYLYDDHVSTDDKSVVVDWYYHTEYGGKRQLQYCKFVNDVVLYATENDTTIPTMTEIDPETNLPVSIPTGEALATRGLYDHGMYPFVCQQLFPVEGSICGYGLTDIGRDAQIQIDIMNKAITDNAVASASPRFFTRNDGTINEEEFLDQDKPLVHVAGNISEDYIRRIEVSPLPAMCMEALNYKIEELKYCTSNQDSNNGVAPSGVTAASAIAALQETAGKNARSANKTMHRAFRDVCYQVVELIRQFYDIPRTFRIIPDDAKEQFVQFSNAGIAPQPQMDMQGNNMGFRLPEFDIDVTSEKASPYKKMEQNELALNFYQQGFFNPQMADQALGCLRMMDFDGKDDVIQMVEQNGTIMQQLLQYQQIALTLAQKYEPQTADALANQILGEAGQPVMGGDDVDLSPDEHPYVEKAREGARASTQAD